MSGRLFSVGKEQKFFRIKFKSNPGCHCHCCGFCCPCRCKHPFLPVPPTCHYLVYVTDAGQLATPDNRVSVIDTATNTIVASIPVGTAPLEVAITPNGAFGYVPALFSDNITVFDTATNMLVTTIPVGSEPLGVAISPNGALAYVSNHG